MASKIPVRVNKLSGVPLDNFKEKGIWFWDANRVQTDPDKCIGILASQYITHVYLTYTTVDIAASKFKYFISKCHERGMKVHALFGDPSWCLTTGRSFGTTAIDSVKTYNDSATAEEKFDGIQFDCEPHGLIAPRFPNSEWTTDKPRVLLEWIDNSDAWIAQSRGYGITFGGAFAFWLDGETPPSAYAPSNMAQVMLGKYDYYAIMAYRDTAALIESVSVEELGYNYPNKLIIGVETTNQGDSTVSFYEEGKTAMETAILQIHNDKLSNVNYRGIALHDFTQIEKWSGAGVKTSLRDLVKMRSKNSL